MILLQNIMENVNGFCFSLTLNDDYALPTWPKADFLGVLQFFIRSHCFHLFTHTYLLTTRLRLMQELKLHERKELKLRARHHFCFWFQPWPLFLTYLLSCFIMLWTSYRCRLCIDLDLRVDIYTGWFIKMMNFGSVVLNWKVTYGF